MISRKTNSKAERGAQASAVEIQSGSSAPAGASTNGDGAEQAAIANFDPAKIGADIKAKLAEADQFEAERKETVAAAKAVYDAERMRTTDEMAAAKLACNTAATAATKKYGPLIKQAKKDAGKIIVTALQSHPEQAEEIRKESGLEKGRWSELFRIAGGKLTAEENRANSAARQQDKRSKDRAAAGKQPTKHDIERAATKAVRDRSDEGVSRTTQATQTTESAETATTNGADHEESATTATETNGTNAGTAEATALDLARAAYFELMPSDYEGRKLELVAFAGAVDGVISEDEGRLTLELSAPVEPEHSGEIPERCTEMTISPNPKVSVACTPVCVLSPSR